jgi:hypothetical protein
MHYFILFFKILNNIVDPNWLKVIGNVYLGD